MYRFFNADFGFDDVCGKYCTDRQVLLGIELSSGDNCIIGLIISFYNESLFIILMQFSPVKHNHAQQIPHILCMHGICTDVFRKCSVFYFLIYIVYMRE
jgi:hypothetical protein